MKISIKLNKRKEKQTKKGAPIVIYVTQNYKQREWATGYYAKPNEWNSQKALPTSKHPNYYLVLDYINLINARILNVYRKNEHSTIALDEVKNLLFNREYSIFYEAAIALIGDENYDDTRLAAVNAFNVVFPNYGFSQITKSIVDKFIKSRLADGKKPSGVDSYIRSLRSLWNKTSELPNPFSGHTIQIPKKIQPVSSSEDLKKLATAKLTSRKKSISGPNHYRNYWLLMFYLGGIDPEVLVRLRYDENVVNGRINFNRQKGQSNTACSNIISDQATQILKQYNCKPYLVPIFKSSNQKAFIANMTGRMNDYFEHLQLSVPIRSKSARHTFIDRAQQLLIDERIAAQIVGHVRRTTTSIYTNDFPKEVQDQAHLKIIDIL